MSLRCANETLQWGYIFAVVCRTLRGTGRGVIRSVEGGEQGVLAAKTGHDLPEADLLYERGVWYTFAGKTMQAGRAMDNQRRRRRIGIIGLLPDCRSNHPLVLAARGKLLGGCGGTRPLGYAGSHRGC